MAADIPLESTQKEAVTFKLLYRFQNSTLEEASDKRRALLCRFKHVSLYGDGELSVWAARRSLFPEDPVDIAQPLALAWHTMAGHRYGPPGLRAVPEETALGVLCHADSEDAFLSFGCLARCNLPRGCKTRPVSTSGVIDTSHEMFVTGDFIEQAWADSAAAAELLQGNVLNAWWQEDATEMQVQVVLEEEANDGNFSTYFVVTTRRVYVVKFATS